MKHNIILSLSSVKCVLHRNRLFIRIYFDDTVQVIGFIGTQFRWMHNKCSKYIIIKWVCKEFVHLILSRLAPVRTHSGTARHLGRIAYVLHVDTYERMRDRFTNPWVQMMKLRVWFVNLWVWIRNLFTQIRNPHARFTNWGNRWKNNNYWSLRGFTDA